MQLASAKRTSIQINGERMETTAATLAELVAHLGHADNAVATALNGEFIPRAARAATTLAQDDQVEIVAPRQGG
ncbi:MAG: sulfur carrier protein ThiS [Hyphomicrobiaceae bacterium]|nr:MAG: sulfur carrier protein ThiS [Hyphomicrobiaceae bacterium]